MLYPLYSNMLKEKYKVIICKKKKILLTQQILEKLPLHVKTTQFFLNVKY